MKSKPSNTNNIHWKSPLSALCRASDKSCEKLNEAGIHTLLDLVWIIPKRLINAPTIQDFNQLQQGQLFRGHAKIMSIRFKPSFARKGKGNVRLFNADVIVYDEKTNKTILLKWFNTYPNLKKTLVENNFLTFQGETDLFRGMWQIINPTLIKDDVETSDQLLIEYPTYATVSGPIIKKYIDRIPDDLWRMPIDHSQLNQDKLPIQECFRILHGKTPILASLTDMNIAKERLIYEEFFYDQIKIYIRRQNLKNINAPKFSAPAQRLEQFIQCFPYQLTAGQKDAFLNIMDDFNSGNPMMRIVQGDVGCGKTSVAILAALVALSSGKQVAIMCPTEVLAVQHFETMSPYFQKFNFKVGTLVGGQSAKIKKQVLNDIKLGVLNVVIGTHALIQESVEFFDLGLAIIDEQHKFGVEQRLNLAKKGNGVHTLIMTATPIPRTLQLAQYGDLDISTINQIPEGRKGTKTRIVESKNYENYLRFVKTRIELGEQAFIVVPAIEESETIDLKNVNEVLLDYKQYFPMYNIQALHGKLSAQEKNSILEDFAKAKIHILISTSVIEVGINILNATIMSIYNPERFGLSSLHQLRGRVGRGHLPGFFFLLTLESASHEAIKRLSIMEKSNNGFEIAEADLVNRGEGDLFGVNQSGTQSNKKIANIFEHFQIFQMAVNDFNQIKINSPAKLNPLIQNLSNDAKISMTI